ncbi:IS1634 family transposase [Desulfosarcina sp. BuS5]|uniref:IS1634 family transposase n=1 Tax=Desulfosarcina sp. BuS5 TaxID=933262 RepID=UPI0023798DB5|nr:IS1634 family transposase [Desulfosarcina sp. BuS5]
MYIATIPNRKSPPAILLRESYREKGKVKSRTLANLSSLPPQSVEILRRSLKGENLVSTDAFEIIEDGSPAHGHVDAAMTAMRRMVAARILEPKSKLATTLWWADTTLPEILDVSDADEDDLYGAMDWLFERQGRIEKKLADRHLKNNALALYDLTSSYFEGCTCPLAALGHNRDGKRGKLQVNYGLLTNQKGIPVAVSVFEGNTGDPKTLMPQVEKMRDAFGIEKFVMVGDRGMLTQKQIDALHDIDGLDWIGALRPEAIKKLATSGAIQMGLFDERNLFEVKHPDFSGERLIACRNAELAHRRAIKRDSLLKATVKELDKVRGMVRKGRLRGKKEIDDRVRTILKKYRIGKHFNLDIREDGFIYKVNEDELIAEITAKSKGNQELIEKRLKRSRTHIESISRQLAKLSRKIDKGRLHGQDKIGVRVGKVINKYKVGKHFELDIRDNDFSFGINRDKVKKEAAVDGIYIVRTSLSKERMDANETVRSYKLLSQAERAFRSFKTVDLMVRPIRHRLEDRVRAHIFLCMLAYYVQWHMMEAWRPLLYADEDQKAKNLRDPVAPAKRSDSAMKKIRTKRLDDGSRVHSFRSLLGHLGSIVRATCHCSGEKDTSNTFTMITKRNQKQQKAFDLLQTIRV